MTDSQGGEAAIVETTEGAEGAPVSSERDYEAEARKDGWKPLEEFAGEKTRWKDAKAWVEYGELRDRIRKDVAAEYEGRFNRLEKMGQRTQDAIKKGYEAQIAELKAERREAIKKGDDKLVDQYDEAIDKVREAAKADDTPDTDAEVEAAFIQRNDWYGTDEELTALAERHSRLVAEAYRKEHNKPMPYDLNLKEVEKRVKASALWKSKNEKTAANGHAAVDGGSDSPAPAPKASSLFAKLPPEAKAQAAKDVKDGLYKNNEDWAKAYFS